MLSPFSALGGDAYVALVDCYGDGTVWAGFQDSEGRRATVCIDGRTGSPTQHRLFDRAQHPRQSGAVLLDLGSPEEGAIVPLISRWLDSVDQGKHGPGEYFMELVQGSLLRLGEPIGTRGFTMLEVVLPVFLEKPNRQEIVDHLEGALKLARLGHITGGGHGAGITDIFVQVSDAPAGLRVIRNVLRDDPRASGAVIKQYEPVQLVYPLEQ